MPAIIVIAIVVALIIWKLSPTRNSHKLPQSVDIPEFHDPSSNPELAGYEKGHKLMLSREQGDAGYHLYVTISTNGKKLSSLKKIIIRGGPDSGASFLEV